jgi:flagellar assembly protein FliH
MALLRQSVASFERDAIVLDLGDLKQQADVLRARARAEADQIIAMAKAERERLLATAHEEGRQAGFAQGLDEGRASGRAEGTQAALDEQRAKLAQLDARWTAAVKEFESRREQVLLEARTDVLKLAVMLGEMVAKRALDIHEAAAADQLAAVLALLAKPTRVVVLVNPDDLPLLQEALPGLAARMPSASHVELTPDAAVGRGGCILRMPGGGEIDATIPTQLARITEALLPASQESSP